VRSDRMEHTTTLASASARRPPCSIATTASAPSACCSFERAWESSSSRCAITSTGRFASLARWAKTTVFPAPVGRHTSMRRVPARRAESTASTASRWYGRRLGASPLIAPSTFARNHTPRRNPSHDPGARW